MSLQTRISFNLSKSQILGLWFLVLCIPVSNVPVVKEAGNAIATVIKPSTQTKEWINPAPGGILTFWQMQRTTDPVSMGGTNYCHNGLDIAAAEGSPVVAARDGLVVYADYNDLGYGWMVILKHETSIGEVYSMYGHNSGLLVKVGQKVKAGNAIAKMGNTGHSAGTHLHWVLMDGLGNSFPVNYLPKQWEVKIDVYGQPTPPKECSRFTPKIAALIK